MIVPMKKVSLIIKGDKRRETLKRLRKLGILQIEITEGSGEKLEKAKGQISLLENASAYVQEKKQKKIEMIEADVPETLEIAKEVVALAEEKKECQAEGIAVQVELERIKEWGEFDPQSILDLAEKGIEILFFETPKTDYEKLDDCVKILSLGETKTSVRFAIVRSGIEGEDEVIDSLNNYRFELPQMSAAELNKKAEELNHRVEELEEKIASYAGYLKSMKKAIKASEKDVEFETFATGMMDENISTNETDDLSVSYFNGYIEADNVELLKQEAKEHSWGLVIEEPTEEDNVPTKLKNNKFVSLVYPLTDFLNVVPGYNEYDISGWFLVFILIFFGMIFGDGGYGILVTAVAAVPIVKALASKKTVPPTFILVALLGLSTIVWGTLTCTWFGLTPEQLPGWLKSLSIPVISNVYSDKIWVPFWMENGVGLTTAQNLQIFCFILALIQLEIAHIKVAITTRKSLRVLGEVGSIIELLGMFYLVLSLVVNGEVFSFGLVISGIPVGTLAIASVAVGFVMNFVFVNYNGSILKSILESLVNIVSVLLGIFNLFSDIVSYIRLWAVGLAGGAISATVNEMAGPLLGHFAFMIFAIILLVFGHGLNMILNVLSVIVHGVRLNTLEFSNHLGMSWSGYKFRPFEEEN